MRFFYLSPDDHDWLKCWLFKHAMLVLLIVCFWVIMYTWPNAETSSSPLVVAQDRLQAAPLVHVADTPTTVGYEHRLESAREWDETGPKAVQIVALPMTCSIAAESSAAVPHSSRNLPSLVSSTTAVKPTGWRRTRNGWENTVTWHTSLASLGEIVRQQQEREIGWFKKLLASVRSIPPWGVALLQLTAVAGILIFERWAAAYRSQRAIRNEAT